MLDSFLKERWSEMLFILSKGALEAYLPTGYKSKDMEKLIELVSSENMIEMLPQENFKELGNIITEIQK